MMSVIRALFWLWVLTSVVILLYRGVRKVTNRGMTEVTPVASSEPFMSDDHLRSAPPLPPIVERSAPIADPLTPSSPETAPIPSLGGGSIFDPQAAGAAPAPAGGAKSIAELVVGIRMPCDLVPILDQVPRAGTRESVSFWTTGHDAVEVGQAMGEELRRLDFELEPITAMRVRATKAAGSLEVEVHPDATLVAHSGLRAYPNARPGSVAVELWR